MAADTLAAGCIVDTAAVGCIAGTDCTGSIVAADCTADTAAGIHHIPRFVADSFVAVERTIRLVGTSLRPA